MGRQILKGKAEGFPTIMKHWDPKQQSAGHVNKKTQIYKIKPHKLRSSYRWHRRNQWTRLPTSGNEALATSLGKERDVEEGFIGVELHFLDSKVPCPLSQSWARCSEISVQSFHVTLWLGVAQPSGQIKVLVHLWGPTWLCATWAQPCGHGESILCHRRPQREKREPECTLFASSYISFPVLSVAVPILASNSLIV